MRSTSLLLLGLLFFAGVTLHAESPNPKVYYQILSVDGPENSCVTAVPNQGHVSAGLAPVKDGKDTQMWRFVPVPGKKDNFHLVNAKHGDKFYLALASNNARSAMLMKPGKGAENFFLRPNDDNVMIVSDQRLILASTPKTPRFLSGISDVSQGKYLFKLKQVGPVPGAP